MPKTNNQADAAGTVEAGQSAPKGGAPAGDAGKGAGPTVEERVASLEKAVAGLKAPTAKVERKVLTSSERHALELRELTEHPEARIKLMVDGGVAQDVAEAWVPKRIAHLKKLLGQKSTAK